MPTPNPDLYHDDLLSLPEQLQALRHINERYWQNHLSEEQLAVLPVPRNPLQRLGAVTSLHVEFSSPAETLLRWRDAYFRSNWGMAHWNMVAVGNEDGGKDYLRLHESARRYEPGIHIVTTDLTYRIEDGESLDTVRSDATQQGHHLAQGELISLIGLHEALRRPREKHASYIWKYNPYIGGYENNDPWYTQQSPQAAWRWVLRYDTGHHPGQLGIRAFMASARRYGSVPRVLNIAE